MALVVPLKSMGIIYLPEKTVLPVSPNFLVDAYDLNLDHVIISCNTKLNN